MAACVTRLILSPILVESFDMRIRQHRLPDNAVDGHAVQSRALST